MAEAGSPEENPIDPFFIEKLSRIVAALLPGPRLNSRICGQNKRIGRSSTSIRTQAFFTGTLRLLYSGAGLCVRYFYRCYIQHNPLLGVMLPHNKKKAMQAISNDDAGRFLEAIKEHKYEAVFLFDIFNRLRQGELLGLTWDCIDFNAGTVTVKKQLQRERVKV